MSYLFVITGATPVPLSSPNPAVCWERHDPGQRPGERLINGRPYVFDLDALNGYLAQEAVDAAPQDLGALTGPELTSLDYRCTRRLADAGGRDPDALALHTRLTAERRRRGLDHPFTLNPSAT